MSKLVLRSPFRGEDGRAVHTHGLTSVARFFVSESVNLTRRGSRQK